VSILILANYCDFWYLQLKDKTREGVIEHFSDPGKALGQVDPGMLHLYNS